MLKILKLKNFLYAELFKINDTPERIALGLGLGVASGIIPGTGPLAALCLAVVFKANRAGALLGSLLTNTWLSLVTFFLALRIGSAIFRIGWDSLQAEWEKSLAHFHWGSLFKVSFLKVVLPVLTGYILIAVFLGALVYPVSLIIMKKLSLPAGRQARRKDEA